MSRVLTFLSALTLAAVLAGCGFHLRGLGDSTPRTFPFARLYVDSKYPIGKQVGAALKAYPNISVVDTAGAADAVLRIVDEQRGNDLSAIDRSGQATEYQLSYRVTAQLWLNGSQIGRDIELHQSRTMTYNDTLVLGKDQEQSLLWDDMVRNAAQLMVYRLSNTQMMREASSAAQGQVLTPKATP